MRPRYRNDSLRVLHVLSLFTAGGVTREYLATRSRLSVTGCTARFRGLRHPLYGCTVSCRPYTVTGFSGKPVTNWVYRLVRAPAKLLREARKHVI